MTESNNMASNSDNEPVEATQPQDFGLRLKQAREAAGYSIVDVSDQLKLTPDQIEWLCADYCRL